MSHRGVAFAFALLAACGKSSDAPPAPKPLPSPPPSLASVVKGARAAPPLPDACTAWKAAMARYAACDRVPPDVRDAIGKAFVATSARWAASGDRDALGDACATGLDGVQAQLGAAGCR